MIRGETGGGHDDSPCQKSKTVSEASGSDETTYEENRRRRRCDDEDRLLCTVTGGLEELAEFEIRQCVSKANIDTQYSSHTIEWATQGHSGSQLVLILRGRNDEGGGGTIKDEFGCESECRASMTAPLLRLLTRMLSQLHFIEYLHYQVGSIQVKLPTTVLAGKQVPRNADENVDISLRSSSTENASVELSPTGNDSAMGLLRTAISDQVSKEMIDEAIQVFRHCQVMLNETIVNENDMGLESLPGQLLPTIEVAHETEAMDVNKSDSKGPDGKESYDRPFIVNTIYTRPAVAATVTKLFVDLVAKHRDQGGVDKAAQSNEMLWVDAGSGSGELLRHLPMPNRIGIDIHPSSPEVHEMDFFEVSSDWLFSNSTASSDDSIHPRRVCVISNPPFAEQSRGDYVPIVNFINHSATALRASYIGVIVPVQFCRQRIWKSLGLDPRVQLLSRCFLPIDSFYDPSRRGNKSGKVDASVPVTKRIKSMFLFFQVHDGIEPEISNDGVRKSSQDQACFSSPIETGKMQKRGVIYVAGKRNKGDFPWLSTSEFTNCLIRGLKSGVDGIQLGLEADSEVVLHANASKATNELYCANELSTPSRQPSPKKQKKTRSPIPVMTEMKVDLSVCLNPKQPLSLLNSECAKIPNHSLGWLSNSVRPPLARAIGFLSMADKEVLQRSGVIKSEDTVKKDKKKSNKTLVTGNAEASVALERSSGTSFTDSKMTASLVVNIMSGEGTIEVESTASTGDTELTDCDRPSSSKFFMISGDANESSLKRAADRLGDVGRQTIMSSCSAPESKLTDFVVWDAHRLPLRSDIADAVLADLPFMGSSKTAHQVPTAASGKSTLGSAESSSSLTFHGSRKSTMPALNYQRVITESYRILQNSDRTNTGRASFVSADSKALSHAVTKCHDRWNILLKQGVNIGGLQGKLFLLERKSPSFKDMSVWVLKEEGKTGNSYEGEDLSNFILRMAIQSCSDYYVDKQSLELKTRSSSGGAYDDEHLQNVDTEKLVTRVEMKDRFYHPVKKLWTHCYRIWFHGRVLNAQAKLLEKGIRSTIEKKLPKGYELR